MPSLRESRTDDADAEALLIEYFAVRTATFPGGGYRTALPSPDTFVAPDGIFLLLLDDDGVAMGCGGIRRVPDGPLGERRELKHLFVRDAARGRGWGRMLLVGLERRAAAAGASEMVLDTHHSLEAAGSLYARAGYAPIEPYNDNPNATRWYAKPLG